MTLKKSLNLAILIEYIQCWS